MIQFNDLKLDLLYKPKQLPGMTPNGCFFLFSKITNDWAEYVEIEPDNEEDGPITLHHVSRKEYTRGSDDLIDSDSIELASWDSLFTIYPPHQLIYDTFDYK
jgi:hypothetical protein